MEAHPSAATYELPNPDKILNDRRADNGNLDIVLRWVENTLSTYVTVTDYRTDEFFRVDVPDGISPNDVFNHPFAYRQDYGNPAATE